ncbi:MAG: N-acetylneuraminate synthase [Bacteroidetes bacterium]|nr:MAG: N-acetylneuraminate synthase [Bacteroidota bacterium]
MKVELIAEIGQAHEGSLGLAHSYIDALAGTGVHTVKFQVHIAEAESSQYEPFRVKFSYEDDTRYDYWQRMEFTADQWAGLKQHCEDKGMEFGASPFSQAAVDLLEKIGVKNYKIGSGEVSNFLMLEKIAQTGKPILLSSGMSSFEELDKSVDFIKGFGNDIILFQCTTQYPTSAENSGLNVIPQMKERYGLKVGLSDHSGTIYPSLGAVALGAELLEFHVVFDKKMFGPDASSSLTIEQVKQLSEGVNYISTSLANPVDKNNTEKYTQLKAMFGKSLAVNKNLPAGHILTFDDLESKKPAGYGISTTLYKNVLGKTLARDLSKWDFLTENDIN